jgi:2-polyprenyl-6-methoxyphenol hydroxylase-like FAD-dependent oxidoreductase
MRIAISGAGIAGTALAYWLKRYGHESVLIEKAPKLRTGGYVVDFWGLGLTVTERMGLLDKVMEQGYVQREVRFVGNDNSRVGGFSTEIIHKLTDGRFTTIRRGALVEIFFEALNGQVESLFADQITKLTEGPDTISVALQHGGEREFDLVVGADGLHSAVRELSSGPEANFENYLGYTRWRPSKSEATGRATKAFMSFIPPLRGNWLDSLCVMTARCSCSSSRVIRTVPTCG